MIQGQVDDQGQEVRRVVEHAEVRATEPMYFIPDPTVAAACRAFGAADWEGVDRLEAIQAVSGGLMVPGCVYEFYYELADYPPPCCSCGPPHLSFLFRSPLYAQNNVGVDLFGGGFRETMRLFVDGQEFFEDDDWALYQRFDNEGMITGPSDIAMQFYSNPYNPPESVGTTREFWVISDGIESNHLFVPILAKPPPPQAVLYSPNSAPANTELTMTVQGSGFLPGDGIRVHIPGMTFAYYFFRAHTITDTSMTARVRMTAVGTAPIYAYRPNPNQSARLVPDMTWT